MRRLTSAIHRLEEFWFEPTDPRIYALLRISFSVVSLCNLADLWPHRQAFFAASGLIDLQALEQNIGSDPYWSIFTTFTSEQSVTLVFLVAALSLLCLSLGVLQRPAAVVIFVFHLSYTNRAFPIIHGWDDLLRMTSFVIMLSPLPSTWTLKSLLSVDRGGADSPVSRHGLILLRVQVCVIYWQTLWLKLGDEFWRNGEYIAYFQLSMYSRAPVEWWAHAELASSVLTFGTLAVELLLPILLLNTKTRWWGLALGVVFHLGILTLSIVWIFSLAILVPYFAFLDGRDIEAFRRFTRRRAPNSMDEEPE